MQPEKILFPSRDGKTTIYAEKYVPEKEIRGILIVAHGMNEHFGRYRELCEVLSNEGYLVAGPDHLGHGHTARDHQGEFGYFAENDGATVVVRDLHRLKKLIQEEYPGKPVFLLGHSMGSFIARNYISMYGTGIQGVIIMGTARFSDLKVRAGLLYVRLSALFHGWHYRDRFCTKTSIGPYENCFPGDGPAGWLCARKEGREYDLNDDLGGNGFTLNGYYGLSTLILRMQDKSRINEIPKDLPVLFMSGAEDPVGEYGAGIKAVEDEYRKAGIRNLSVKLYPGDRHELYHEADRFNVFFDIMEFMKEASETWKC